MKNGIKKTSRGQNPNVSTDSFGSAIRQGNTDHEKLMRDMRVKREKEQMDKLTAVAKSKSWDDTQKYKNKKGIFESLNKIFK